MIATANTVKPFHEKRGRPRNQAVNEAASVFRGLTKTRRSDWNHYYMTLAIGHHLRAVLGDRALDDVRAGRSDLPLPTTVLHALGTLPPGKLARRLTRECLRRRQAGERAHDLATWVRRQIGAEAMKAVMKESAR